jgi:lipopolysaccharide export system permease protein
MNTLAAYVFRQALGPLLAILGGLAAIALLTQGLNQLDIIVSNRQSGFAFAWVTFLATPQLVSLLLPLAVFFAVAFAINRMQSESETVVIYASGVSNGRLARPLMQLAFLAAAAHLGLNLLLQPAANREMRETIHDIRASVASALVREGSFTFPSSNLTLYARDRGPGGEMRDLMIHDARTTPAVTYTSRAGILAMIEGQPAIVMRDGQVQRQREDGTLQVLDFYQYALKLEGIGGVSDDLYLKPSDRFLLELFYPDPTHHFDQRNVKRFLAEAHYRLSSPLLSPALALVALSGLLVGEFSRRGYARRLVVAAIVALLVRLFALAIQSAALDNPDLNPLQYIFPIVVSLIAGARLVMAAPRKPPRRLRVAKA